MKGRLFRIVDIRDSVRLHPLPKSNLKVPQKGTKMSQNKCDTTTRLFQLDRSSDNIWLPASISVQIKVNTSRNLMRASFFGKGHLTNVKKLLFFTFYGIATCTFIRGSPFFKILSSRERYNCASCCWSSFASFRASEQVTIRDQEPS